MEIKESRRILAIDVGGGTQDIIVYDEEENPENFVQLVLPSPTSLIAKKVREAAEAHRGIHLTGTIMGGGSSVRALKDHISAGLSVTAEEEAAKTVKDDLERVKEYGIELTDTPPPGHVVIETKDVDTETLKQVFELYRVEMPSEIAVAVQDHGDPPPGKSNRDFRFEYWREFIQGGGSIYDLAFSTPPDYFTRMRAVQETVPGALVMDTCAAAIWGSFVDDTVKNNLPRGAVLINIGNQHTFAALVQQTRIYGLFEHHTGRLTTEKLVYFVDKLCRNDLTHEEVYNDGGHGCHIAVDAPTGYDFIGVTGPRRRLAKGLGYHMVNPHGDMMMTGCFGLVEAVKSRGG